MMVVVILDDDEILLRNDEILSVHLTENLRLQNIFGRSGGKETGLEQN